MMEHLLNISQVLVTLSIFESLCQRILTRTLWNILYFLFIVEKTEVHREQDIAQHKIHVCDIEEKKYQRVWCQGEIWNIVI